jgi:transcriptional regulator with XRE-family HTH domain
MTTTTKTPGTMLKEARLALGLTQDELAEAVKVTQPTVSRWEKNQLRPVEDQREALSALLNIDASIWRRPGRETELALLRDLGAATRRATRAR